MGIVDVVDIEDPADVLLDQFEHLLQDGEIGLRFLLYFEYDFILEDEAGVEKSFVVADELLPYAFPHVVQLAVVVVDVEDVPALHECGVFGEKGVLHVFEVVFCHLVVHLVLKCL